MSNDTTNNNSGADLMAHPRHDGNESSGATTPFDAQSHSTVAGEDHLQSKVSVRPESKYITIFLFLACVAFGGFVFGWDTGTISGFVNMSDFKKRFGSLSQETGQYYFSDVRMGLIVSLFNVGCAIGGVFLSKIADMYGRRPALMVMMVIYVVGIVIQISSVSAWYQYLIGRIISGLGVGGVSVIAPMMISESAPAAIRGVCVAMYQLMITAGIFLGYCTTYGTKNYDNSSQWRIPLGLCFAWAIFMCVGMIAMPESPRYLVQKDLLEQARRSIAKSYKLSHEDPAVYAEVEVIHAGIQRESSAGKASWMELITGQPQILLRVISGVMIQSLQQLTGDNYFFYYGTTIFKAVGLSDSFETSIILGVVNFAATIASLFIVDRFGRRKILLTGAITMLVCFVIFACLGGKALYPHGSSAPSNQSAGDGMIFLACFFIASFAMSWAPLAYIVTSEIYPLRIRSKAISLASASNWLWGFLISFFTPFITSAIGFWYGFVFAGCMIFATGFVYFVIPETKGLSLEEIDELYAARVPAWVSSEWTPSLVAARPADDEDKRLSVEHA